MRILVTGGAGFIASHVGDRFVALGHDVKVLDDLSSGRRENLPSGVELIEADVRSEEAARATKAWRPEVICHHAAQIDVRKSVDDPGFDIDVNLVGLMRVVEAARQGGALEHVLFASSGGAMYGEQESFPADEDHVVRPVSPYGLAKATGEQYLDLWFRMYGLRYTALRYANVYGPRQSAHGEAGVVAIFSGRLLKGAPITIYGDGKQTRDYVFVGDVVEANALALEHRLLGGYNVGTGVETDVVTLAERLIALTGAQVEPTFADARAGEQARSVITSAKLKAATGFAPSVSLDEGLAQTVAHFRKELGRRELG